MNAEEIMEILRGLDPGAVAAAGASYTAAANTLEALAGRLARHAGTLSEHWDGAAADAALASLRRSREQARSAAAQAQRTGAALTWLGNEVLPVFRSLPDPAGQPDAHAVASRYLAALDDYLTVAAKALPLSPDSSRTCDRGGAPLRAGQHRALPTTFTDDLYRGPSWPRTRAAGSTTVKRLLPAFTMPASTRSCMARFTVGRVVPAIVAISSCVTDTSGTRVPPGTGHEIGGVAPAPAPAPTDAMPVRNLRNAAH